MRARKVLLACALLPAIVSVQGLLPDYPLSGRELKARSSYYTDSGKYLGGIPKYDDELEMYGCTGYNTNSTCYTIDTNATACTAWTANEVGSDEHEEGSCSCEAITNEEYCSAWTCAQTETSNTATCSGEAEYRTCWYEQEQETTRCACESEQAGAGAGGTYCASWTCVETEADGSQELEDYLCVTESTSGTYCEAWTGVIESAEEVEVSTCECLQEKSGGGVCTYWECNERGLTKCSHGGPSWCNLGVSVGVGGFFGSLGAAMASWGMFALYSSHPHTDCENKAKIFVGLLWMFGWSAGVVVWGGQDGATYCGVWWGAVILYGLLRRFHRDGHFDCIFHVRSSTLEECRTKQPSAQAPAPTAAAAIISKDEEIKAGQAFAVNFVETPPAHLTTPPANVDTPSAHLTTPTADVETPPAHLTTPPADVDTPEVHLEEPSG